jgi:hypothetical protein
VVVVVAQDIQVAAAEAALVAVVAVQYTGTLVELVA